MAAEPDGAPPEVRLRPMVDNDSMLIFELYASARVEELARTGWATPQQRSFLRLQAQNREAHFARTHEHLVSRTVCIDGFAAGRVLVDQDKAGIHLVDVGLLPSYRNRGIGTTLMHALFDEARAAEMPVHVDVAKGSKEAALCERLGFAERVDQGSSWRLTWRPTSVALPPG